MTYRCGLGRADVFAGLAALSATMPNPRELEKQLPVSREQPIFVAHGLSDPLVPLESAHGARSFLEGAGYHPAPGITCLVMLRMANPIDCRVTHVDIRRCHINFQTQHMLAIGELASTHAFE